MRYITGIHALNLPCDLDTCSDWHTSGLHWKKGYKTMAGVLSAITYLLKEYPVEIYTVGEEVQLSGRLDKLVQEHPLKDIPSIHRLTIDGAGHKENMKEV